jgi:hypothetical protein
MMLSLNSITWPIAGAKPRAVADADAKTEALMEGKREDGDGVKMEEG